MRPVRRPFRGAIDGAIPLMFLGMMAAGAIATHPVEAAAISPPRCPIQAVGSPGREASGDWWRLDPLLDGSGGLVGQDLRAGGPGGPRYRVSLPAESFVSGPVGGMILIGADDGSASEISLLDLAAGCLDPVATDATVVRRAVVGPTGSSIFEFHLDRTTRADLGVWRRDLITGGRPVRILEPLRSDNRFGITWSTELNWSDDGRLVVGSCGALACRTRIVEAGGGSVITVDDPDLGEPLGVARGQLVSYQACRGLPCPIVTVDLEDGARHPLIAAAGRAALVDVGGETVLVHEARDSDATLEVVGLSGVPLGEIGLSASTRLVTSASRTASAVDLPSGWIAVGIAGRIDARGPSEIVRLQDGSSSSVSEVAP